jgi:hypothetical protein
MNTCLGMIRQHRAALQVKAAAQRAEMAELVQPWRAPFRFADWVVALTRLARTQPLAITLLMGLLMRMGHGHWSVWAGRLWSGWHIYRTFIDMRSKDRS